MIVRTYIVIRNDKAFIPVLGKTDSGLYVSIDPVFITNIEVNEIKDALMKVDELGHPHVQLLMNDGRKPPLQTMLKATGAKSWKELGRTGYCYTLSGNKDSIFLQISRLDQQGRWEYDPEKEHIFSPYTPIEDIVKYVIEDYRSR